MPTDTNSDPDAGESDAPEPNAGEPPVDESRPPDRRAAVRFKMVPAPPEDRPLERLRDAWRTIPIVPADEDDCCERLMQRVGFASRDVSRAWLTFLRALGVVERTGSGFKRVGEAPAAERLREAFLDRILLSHEVLWAASKCGSGAALATPKAVFDRIRSDVPTYERYKNPDSWESIWRERTGHVLEWLVAFDLLERVGPAGTDLDDDARGEDPIGYVPTDRGRDRIE